MAGISASTARLAAVAETAWGTTPATPAFKNIRITGESLNADKQVVTSNELRPDRNVPDVIQTGRSAAGTINAELSYGAFDDLLESMFYGAWATNVLKNGTTQKSFTLEKTLKKNPTGSLFMRYPGAVVGGWSLDVSAGQIITTSFDVMAKGVSTGVAAITGATYATAGTADVMSAATDFASLSMTGVTGTPIIQSLQLSANNGLRQRMAVGSLDSQGIGEARFEVTGSMNAYFEDEALYNAFLAHSALGLSFQLGSSAGSRYTVAAPKVKLTTGQILATGNDGDLMVNVGFQALYDATAQATLQLTRAV